VRPPSCLGWDGGPACACQADVVLGEQIEADAQVARCTRRHHPARRLSLRGLGSGVERREQHDPSRQSGCGHGSAVAQTSTRRMTAIIPG
jgi:hypothetical protein